MAASVTIYRSFGAWRVLIIEDGKECLRTYPTPDWAESVARAEAERLNCPWQMEGNAPPSAITQ